MTDEPFRPAAVRELFDTKGDMTLKTETPSRMILPLVRLAIIRAAADPRRKKSLLEVFQNEFDKRMISKERKGRLELLAAMQSVSGGEDDDDAVL